MLTLRVEPATAADLSLVQSIYADARALQATQGSLVWPVFDEVLIRAEIEEGRVYFVKDDDALVGVFSVAYSDPAIWGEHERGEHIYLHRIARSAGYSGGGLVRAVIEWARAHREALGRAGLRMDTWASNDVLIAYYGRFGFQQIGSRRIGVDPRLPEHYHGGTFALLEERREPSP